MSFLGRLRGLVTKQAVPPPVSARTGGFDLLMLRAGEGPITPHTAWELYKSCATFAMAVDLIADQVAGLEPLVQVGGEAVEGHPALDVLRRPGYQRTRRRLIKELAVQYLVTGTAYLQANGNVGSEPVSLDVKHTRHVQALEGDDGWPGTLHVAEPRRQWRFVRAEGIDQRYFADGLAELVPIYDIAGDCKGVGLSRLQAVRADVELKLKGTTHNKSLMDKGARFSGLLSFKSKLTQDQAEQIRADLRANSGPSGAGGIMISDGGENDFKPFAMSPKDMDWANLSTAVERAIISRYNIPITLFATEAQTYSNYQEAWIAFYDNAVLPCFEVIYAGIARLLSDRYGEDIEIVHDALTNSTLAQRAINRAKDMLGAQMITPNEARAEVGYEPMAGGDDILGPPGMVPNYRDIFTEIDPDGDGTPGVAGGDAPRPGAHDPRAQAPSRTAVH